jgi:hypothetical protein
LRNYRVLVVGGYGFFGSRLVERLSRRAGLHVVVAGRHAQSAEILVERFKPTSLASLQSATIDAMSSAFDRDIQNWEPDVLVHTSGPFQGQSYQVAEACIKQKVHYVDLADASGFVAGITKLDADARAANVLVTSGASSVPALSSAAVDYLSSDMSHVRSIDIGISPGNRTERGLSTIQGILSYCGKPILQTNGRSVTGWGRSYRHDYAEPVGSRLLSACDVPDLKLFPLRYAGKPAVRFGAGLELEFLHRGMNVMAAVSRFGLVKDWSVHAKFLKRASDIFKRWGSDAGAMHVCVTGHDSQGFEVTHTWELQATFGDGPFVPTLAAAALVQKLASGVLSTVGAKPCIGLLTLDELTQEASGLNITTKSWASK